MEEQDFCDHEIDSDKHFSESELEYEEIGGGCRIYNSSYKLEQVHLEDGQCLEAENSAKSSPPTEVLYVEDGTVFCESTYMVVFISVLLIVLLGALQSVSFFLVPTPFNEMPLAPIWPLVHRPNDSQSTNMKMNFLLKSSDITSLSRVYDLSNVQVMCPASAHPLPAHGDTSLAIVHDFGFDTCKNVISTDTLHVPAFLRSPITLKPRDFRSHFVPQHITLTALSLVLPYESVMWDPRVAARTRIDWGHHPMCPIHSEVVQEQDHLVSNDRFVTAYITNHWKVSLWASKGTMTWHGDTHSDQTLTFLDVIVLISRCVMNFSLLIARLASVFVTSVLHPEFHEANTTVTFHYDVYRKMYSLTGISLVTSFQEYPRFVSELISSAIQVAHIVALGIIFICGGKYVLRLLCGPTIKTDQGECPSSTYHMSERQTTNTGDQTCMQPTSSLNEQYQERSSANIISDPNIVHEQSNGVRSTFNGKCSKRNDAPLNNISSHLEESKHEEPVSKKHCSVIGSQENLSNEFEKDMECMMTEVSCEVEDIVEHEANHRLPENTSFGGINMQRPRPITTKAMKIKNDTAAAECFIEDIEPSTSSLNKQNQTSSEETSKVKVQTPTETTLMAAKSISTDDTVIGSPGAENAGNASNTAQVTAEGPSVDTKQQDIAGSTEDLTTKENGEDRSDIPQLTSEECAGDAKQLTTTGGTSDTAKMTNESHAGEVVQLATARYTGDSGQLSTEKDAEKTSDVTQPIAIHENDASDTAQPSNKRNMSDTEQLTTEKVTGGACDIARLTNGSRAVQPPAGDTSNIGKLNTEKDTAQLINANDTGDRTDDVQQSNQKNTSDTEKLTTENATKEAYDIVQLTNGSHAEDTSDGFQLATERDTGGTSQLSTEKDLVNTSNAAQMINGNTKDPTDTLQLGNQSYTEEVTTETVTGEAGDIAHLKSGPHARDTLDGVQLATEKDISDTGQWGIEKDAVKNTKTAQLIDVNDTGGPSNTTQLSSASDTKQLSKELLQKKDKLGSEQLDNTQDTCADRDTECKPVQEYKKHLQGEEDVQETLIKSTGHQWNLECKKLPQRELRSAELDNTQDTSADHETERKPVQEYKKHLQGEDVQETLTKRTGQQWNLECKEQPQKELGLAGLDNTQDTSTDHDTERRPAQEYKKHLQGEEDVQETLTKDTGQQWNLECNEQPQKELGSAGLDNTQGTSADNDTEQKLVQEYKKHLQGEEDVRETLTKDTGQQWNLECKEQPQRELRSGGLDDTQDTSADHETEQKSVQEYKKHLQGEEDVQETLTKGTGPRQQWNLECKEQPQRELGSGGLDDTQDTSADHDTEQKSVQEYKKHLQGDVQETLTKSTGQQWNLECKEQPQRELGSGGLDNTQDTSADRDTEPRPVQEYKKHLQGEDVQETLTKDTGQQWNLECKEQSLGKNIQCRTHQHEKCREIYKDEHQNLPLDTGQHAIKQEIRDHEFTMQVHHNFFMKMDQLKPCGYRSQPTQYRGSTLELDPWYLEHLATNNVFTSFIYLMESVPNELCGYQFSHADNQNTPAILPLPFGILHADHVGDVYVSSCLKPFNSLMQSIPLEPCMHTYPYYQQKHAFPPHNWPLELHTSRQSPVEYQEDNTIPKEYQEDKIQGFPEIYQGPAECTETPTEYNNAHVECSESQWSPKYGIPLEWNETQSPAECTEDRRFSNEHKAYTECSGGQWSSYKYRAQVKSQISPTELIECRESPTESQKELIESQESQGTPEEYQAYVEGTGSHGSLEEYQVPAECNESQGSPEAHVEGTGSQVSPEEHRMPAECTEGQGYRKELPEDQEHTEYTESKGAIEEYPGLEESTQNQMSSEESLGEYGASAWCSENQWFQVPVQCTEAQGDMLNALRVTLKGTG